MKPGKSEEERNFVGANLCVRPSLGLTVVEGPGDRFIGIR